MSTDPLIGAEATPVPEMSAEEVRGLHKRWRESTAKAVQQALKQAGLEPEQNARRVSALTKALFEARRARVRMSKSDLAKLAAKSPRQIAREAAREWPDPLSDRSKNRFKGFTRSRNWWGARNGSYYKDRYETEIFKGRDRIYIPLQPPAGQSEAESAVRRRLTEMGYTEIDYAEGKCKDENKNIRKIGRLLSEDASLLHAFQQDATRGWKNQMLVISRDPYDIARMSTGRGWKSCMKQGHPFYRFAQMDAQIGTLVCYCISKDDPHILDPHSRMLLKPHDDGNGKRILVPGVVYGFPNEIFQDTVRNWVENGYNFGKSGKFHRSLLLYGDRQPRKRIRLPENTKGERLEEVFKLVGVAYDKQAGGGYIVKGDLDLSGMGLSKLPDLSNVTVEGDFNCADNVLVSLEGAPKSVSGSFTCANNRLRDLQGVSNYIGIHLIADDNRLESLAGAPQRIRGSLSVVRNRLRTLNGAPSRIDQSFHADYNRLASLAGGPQSVGRNYSARFNKLHALGGAPARVPGDFDVSDNRLPNLVGAPSVVERNFIAAGNHLTDLEGGPEQVGSVMTVTRNPLTSYHGLPRVFRRLQTDRDSYSGRDRVPERKTMKNAPEVKDNTAPAANRNMEKPPEASNRNMGDKSGDAANSDRPKADRLRELTARTPKMMG